MNAGDIDPEVLQLAREEAEERLENIERNMLSVEKGETGPETVAELFRDAHSIKSAAAMLGWDAVVSIAHEMEDRFQECREGNVPLADLAEPMLLSLDALKSAIADGGQAAPVPPPAAAVNGAPPAEPAGTPAEKPAGPEQSIRVAPGKVDRMLDAVGETVLHHRRLEHVLSEREQAAGDDESGQELDLGNRLLGELHDSVIGMRTLPLSSIAAPFPRAIRDAATAEGKEVQLTLSGTDTQLDRSVLEGLGELISHLLRNTVAHGIESPEDREIAGKPRLGRVALEAEQRGGMVAIEVSDDGRGISEEVRSEAEAMGSLTELLSAPGFSTAGGVSDIAGRGVGLDAVKTHVDSMGGNLEIKSEPGAGTRVTMLLPLTLALMRLLMFERGGQPFGLPLTSVREVVTSDQRVSLEGRESLDLGGEAVPFEDLAAVLGASAAPLHQDSPAMVVSASGRSRAVGCDAMLGDKEVVVKGLGSLLGGTPGYLGAAILGDGRVALILDPNHLVRGARSAAAPTAVLAQHDEPIVAQKILVVDDQVSMRGLQRSILETAGYDVQTACDGREALDWISGHDVDLVMTDVEMPEMDGFGLLRAIRDDPDRGSLPVVMVSGLGSPEQRKRGADEGADAYIVKEEYDQHGLLDVISDLVGT